MCHFRNSIHITYFRLPRTYNQTHYLLHNTGRTKISKYVTYIRIISLYTYILTHDKSHSIFTFLSNLKIVIRILRFDTIQLSTNMYPKMNLKRLCILQYMNESCESCILWFTTFKDSYFSILSPILMKTFKNHIKLKLLNENELEEHFWTYPIWLLQYLFVAHSFNTCTLYSYLIAFISILLK